MGLSTLTESERYPPSSDSQQREEACLGWSTRTLATVGKCYRGVGYDPDKDLSPSDTDHTVRLLRSNNVFESTLRLEDIQFVHRRRVSDVQLLRRNDLVLCMANGSRALVGKSAHFDVADGYAYTFGAFMGCFRTDASEADPRFVAYLLQSDGFRKHVHIILSGSSINNLRPGDVESASFHMPLPHEQQLIANALSDVDRLIESLDAIIAKKRAIKQATMQQLLTGKTRLPGFTKDWEPTRLDRCGSTYGGITGKGKADFGHGPARYVTFLNVLENAIIQSSMFEAVDIGPAETQNRVRRGDLLFNGTSETPEDVALGACVLNDWDDLYLNSFCFGFRFHVDTDHDPLFFAYFFRGPTGRQLMSALAQGATRYNMSKRQFLRLECPLPDGDEQREISRVLADMDTEIAVIQQRRDKTRAIKQGMMQQLLTGRIRLVTPEGAA